MKGFFGNKFMRLIFLSNVLQLGVTGDEGGGSAGGEGDGGEAGSEGDEGGSGEAGDKGNQGGSDGDQNKVEDLPEFAQKMIKDLRAESANNRTKNKGLEEKFNKMQDGFKSALGLSDDDQVSPEDQVKNLTSSNDSLSMRNAVLEVAIENGLNKEQSEYFEFLLGKEADSLEENGEISEERYDELVTKSKAMGGASGRPADTSADGDGDTPPVGGSEGDAISLEAFTKMGYADKVSLRKKDSNLYNKLFSEAMSKGLI